MNRISPNHPCFGGDRRLYRKTVRARYLARRERTAWLALIGSLCGAFWLVLFTDIRVAGQPIMGILAFPLAGIAAWAFVTLADLDRIKNP